jgi:hypothetical protein
VISIDQDLFLGEELRRHSRDLSPTSIVNGKANTSRVQYEVVDEDGNPLAIEGIQDLIQMSGVRAREVPQSDGSIVKEYVIDDPKLLSKFRSQHSHPSSPIDRSYAQQLVSTDDAPPPPPRIPLRQPMLFRQGPSTNETLPDNIQQIQVLEPQRRYEYSTSTGRRIQFLITNIDEFNGQSLTDTDIRELTNAINTRLMPVSTLSSSCQASKQAPFSLPKPWHPSVDLTQRSSSSRQRIGSDTQPFSNESRTVPLQAMSNDLTRSASYGTLNNGSHVSHVQQTSFNQPVIDWTALQQQDPQGQIDPHVVRQMIQQRHQTSGSFQTSAQFLPQQQPMTSSAHSPSYNPNHQHGTYYQQSPSYAYQGATQQAMPLVNNNGYDSSQTRITDGQTRI